MIDRLADTFEFFVPAPKFFDSTTFRLPLYKEVSPLRGRFEKMALGRCTSIQFRRPIGRLFNYVTLAPSHRIFVSHFGGSNW